MDVLSQSHTVPLKKWLEVGDIIKLWFDNVDKQSKVRDLRSDNKGRMMHMVSVLAGKSRTPAPDLPHGSRNLSLLDGLPVKFFMPRPTDVSAVKDNLVHIISRVLTHHIAGLAPLAKVVPKHILHKYSREMSQKSEVYTLDVLMKNEAKHSEMIDILRTLHGYLGKDHSDEKIVVCGGDQLTCERQVGAQRLSRCGLSAADRLELLEPVFEDWHCLVTLLRVSYGQGHNIL